MHCEMECINLYIYIINIYVYVRYIYIYIFYQPISKITKGSWFTSIEHQKNRIGFAVITDFIIYDNINNS